jgi:glycosyltransferase involved in cell wall biosynthesis
MVGDSTILLSSRLLFPSWLHPNKQANSMTAPFDKKRQRRSNTRRRWIVIVVTTIVLVVMSGSIFLSNINVVLLDSSSKFLLSTASTTKTSLSYPTTPIYLWPNVNMSNFDDNTLGYSTYSFEYKHFVIEGVQESPFLERVYNSSDHNTAIWITDIYQGKRPSKWCGAIVAAIMRETRPPRLLIIMDWNDDPQFPIQQLDCSDLYNIVRRDNIRYMKRSMVVGRHWNESLQSIELGRIMDSSSSNQEQPIPHNKQHLSYGVRTDLYETIKRIAREEQPQYYMDDWSLLPRPYDVAHFWPTPSTTTTSSKEVNRGGNNENNNSKLRDAVSLAIFEWNQTHPQYFGFAGLTGSAKEKGRVEPQLGYARALLQYKMVVVAQKDDWEGHYRLMEALSGGAMVLSDRMLLLPEGLQDGVSIVMYDNVTDMIQKVEYYLEHASERIKIAREGRRIAMTRHRSWHIMERVVYGTVLSNNAAS